MRTGTAALWRFQPVARQRRQIGEAARDLEPIWTHLSLARETRELSDMSSGSKALGGLVPITDEHRIRVAAFTIYVNSKLGMVGLT